MSLVMSDYFADFEIDVEIYTQLIVLSELTGRSVQEIVGDAVQHYMNVYIAENMEDGNG